MEPIGPQRHESIGFRNSNRKQAPSRFHLPLTEVNRWTKRRLPFMNPFSLLSTVAGALCVLLSTAFYLKSNTVQKLQADLQKRQQEVQAELQEVQLKQQEAKDQQQQIEDGVKLQQQVGPAVLNDLGLLARDNKNEKIRKILEKYGIKLNDTPAPDKPAADPKKP
jgi:septal ring factor EnvC (AmiA/AmiB activator)